MNNKIAEYTNNPYEFLINSKSEELIKLLEYVSNSYFNLSISLISDELYDLLYDEIKKRNINTNILKKVGSDIIDDKVKLPYWMGSQTKIKENNKELLKWKTKYNTNSYVISDKLDGVSALYINNKLYTRGNGEYGKDISHLIEFINIAILPNNSVIRGELIMSKNNFELNKKNGKNARNLVSGQINSKKNNKNILKYIDFVAYELIEPILKPYDQFKYLNDNNFKVSEHIIYNDFNKDKLTEYLTNRRNNSIYEIDGIVVIENKIHKRNITDNPKYSFAYKIIHSDQIGYVTVITVNWNLSKDNYFKPQIQINPINLCGVTIEYLSGFNAKFIVDNKIGKDAELKIIRSGDVIPHILEIIEPSDNVKLPNDNFIWNNTKVDIIAVNETDENNIKKITHFFNTINVKDMSHKIIEKLYFNNFNSINKIISISVQELKNIEGIQDKMANKLYNNIQHAITNIDIIKIMVGSNLLGRGFSINKISKILDKYPDILNWTQNSNYITNKIIKIDGFNNKTASLFASNINKFNDFLHNLPNNVVIKKNIINQKISNKFNNMTIILTGFRKINDIDIEEFIITNGGKISTTVSKNINLLVAKDVNSNSSKVKKAKNLNIKIIDINEFKTLYM